jgi:hypothetical protein
LPLIMRNVAKTRIDRLRRLCVGKRGAEEQQCAGASAAEG